MEESHKHYVTTLRKLKHGFKKGLDWHVRLIQPGIRYQSDAVKMPKIDQNPLKTSQKPLKTDKKLS